jgi:hypothetical protein
MLVASLAPWSVVSIHSALRALEACSPASLRLFGEILSGTVFIFGRFARFDKELVPSYRHTPVTHMHCGLF